MQPTRQANSPISPLVWLCIALPVAIHFLLLIRYAVNAPRLDDFSEVLTFLPDFHAGTHWQDRLRIFFAVYQDHRYGMTHLLNLATDGINFYYYVLGGNLLLVAYCLLVWLSLRSHPQRQLLTLTATLLIFNLHAWSGMYWASILLTSLGSLPIALGTFMLVCSNDRRLLPAAALAAICLTYTLGNGILVWPLACLYCLADNHRTQQKLINKRVLFWLVGGITVAYFYFNNFHFFNREGHGGMAADTFLLRALTNAPAILTGFFSLAGSLLLYYSGQIDWRIYTATVIGLLECLALALLLHRGALRTKPALLMLLAFVVLTMLSIAVARSATINLGQSLQGHYKLYTGTLTLLLVIAHIDWLQQHNALAARKLALFYSGVTASLYIAAIFLFHNDIRNYNAELGNDTRNWLYSNNLQKAETRFLVKNSNKKLLRATTAGFYDPWTLLTPAETPDATEFHRECTNKGTALPEATITSQRWALAVHIRVVASDHPHEFWLCSKRQAIRFTLSDARHYLKTHNDLKANNDQKANDDPKANDGLLELWIPRNPEIGDDEGPWQLYAMTNKNG